MNTLLYFIGLVMAGISVGTFYKVPQYACFIIGCGTFLYGVVVAFFEYLKRGRKI